MLRTALTALLGLGTILGFSVGLASVATHWHRRAEQRQAAFEAHVADICVDAARRVDRPRESVDRWHAPPTRDYPQWAEPPTPADSPRWDRRHRGR